MTIKVGSDVKASDGARGRVTKLTGSNAEWTTSYNEHRTDKVSDLEEVTGLHGTLSAWSPDLMEIVANTVVFGGTQLVRKRKFMGEPTMRFLVEDAVFEFVGKKWFRETIEDKIFKTGRVALIGDLANNFRSQDVKDAVSKTVAIGVIDTVYKLVRGGSVFNKSTLMYGLQVAVSFYLANIGQRQFRGHKDGAYYMT